MAEDDIEEFPIITMNLPNCDVAAPRVTEPSVEGAGVFRMPSAEEVAEERAREAERERELRRLPDDSGEGELVGQGALAGAVGELRVGASPAAEERPSLAALLHALAAELPEETRPLLLHPDALRILPEVCASVREPCAWSEGEVCAVGALLCAAVQAPPRAALAARALHTLLECRATDQQARLLCEVLVRAVRCARTLVHLADTLCAAGGARCAALAHTLHTAALALLLGGRQESEWWTLPPHDALTALRVMGRRLAHDTYTTQHSHHTHATQHSHHTHATHGARTLDALRAAPHRHDARTPHHLKVMVATSRLRLLFGADN